jgi:hypothetical protein
MVVFGMQEWINEWMNTGKKKTVAVRKNEWVDREVWMNG